MSYLVRQVGLTWENEACASYGDAQVTSSHFLWIPHFQDDEILRIPLQSIVAVDIETRGVFKRKKSLKLAIRVDRNRNPTHDVLHAYAMRHMTLQGDDNLVELHDCLNRQVLEASPVSPQVAVPKTSREENSKVQDPRITTIMKLGYEEQIVSAALEACDPGASADDVTSWLLDNEASLKLQLDYDANAFTLGEGGIRGVFSREYKKIMSNFDAIQQGLMNMDNLHALTKDLDRVAHEIFDRKRLNGMCEDDSMEDVMYKSMIQHELIGNPSMKDLPRDVYIQELARQIGHVLLLYSRSSYGALSVSEAYRLYNRSRFQNIIGPRDFIDACCHFERVSVPLVYVKGSNAIFSKEPGMERIQRQILSCISPTHGVSRVHVARQTNIPVGIVTHYLDEAEKQQLLLRDEKSPHGLLYYKNMYT